MHLLFSHSSNNNDDELDGTIIIFSVSISMNWSILVTVGGLVVHVELLFTSFSLFKPNPKPKFNSNPLC